MVNEETGNEIFIIEARNEDGNVGHVAVFGIDGINKDKVVRLYGFVDKATFKDCRQGSKRP